jgi:hypothetical protein
MKLRDIQDLVNQARQQAKKEAEFGRRGCSFSRGTFLSTASKGFQCYPRPSAECPTWNGTLKEIKELIAEVTTKYPEVDEITIGGGYDWAESVLAFRGDDDYEPWASAWEVTVWSKK